MSDNTRDKQNLINGLDELLTLMLSREDILAGPIFRPMGSPQSDDIETVSHSIIADGLLTGKAETKGLHQDNITNQKSFSAHFCGRLLISFLSRLVSLDKIELFEEKDTSQQNLTPSQFNSDLKIKGICYKLFGLFRKISDSTNNNYTAESLAREFSYLIFANEDLQDIMNKRKEQLTQLIKHPYFYTGPEQSSHEKIQQHIGGRPPESSSTHTHDDHEEEENGLTAAAEAPARSFGMKHLSKLLLMPLIALFAAALTVTLLIAFPPGGVALTIGILIAAGVGAGVAGVGAGFGFGAVIDHVREEQYNEQSMKHQNETTPLFAGTPASRTLPTVTFTSPDAPTDVVHNQHTPSKNGP